MNEALAQTLKARRDVLMRQRRERESNIRTWEGQLASARRLIASYDAEMAAIDEHLGAPDAPSTPSTIVLTSDSPITINEGP